MADGSARGGAIPMRSLRLVPYWSVHETLGVDAHNAPLKMRTRRIHLSRAVAWSCVRRHPVAGAALSRPTHPRRSQLGQQTRNGGSFIGSRAVVLTNSPETERLRYSRDVLSGRIAVSVSQNGRGVALAADCPLSLKRQRPPSVTGSVTASRKTPVSQVGYGSVKPRLASSA